jgi:hypothetical protein
MPSVPAVPLAEREAFASSLYLFMNGLNRYQVEVRIAPIPPY